jgi:hypothetical protein
MKTRFRSLVVTIAAFATSVPALMAGDADEAQTRNASQLINKASGKKPTSVRVSDIGTTDPNQRRVFVHSRGAAPPIKQDKQCNVVYQPTSGASFKESVTLALQFLPSRNGRVLLRDDDEHGNTKTNETFVLTGPVDDGTFIMLKANRDEPKIQYGEGVKALTGLAIKKTFIDSQDVVNSFYKLVDDLIPACKAEVQNKKAGTAHDLDDDAPATQSSKP